MSITDKANDSTKQLLWAVEYGSADDVEALLLQGADPEGFTDDPYAFSPLYRVCLHREIDQDRLAIAELLLDAGADVNRVTASRSNVATAARRGRADLVALLLARGADMALTLEDFADQADPPLLAAARSVGSAEVARVVEDAVARRRAATADQ